MKILSIDDSSIVRKIIRGAVETLGYELLEACDGIEGFLVLEKEYKDIGLILLDWNMPGMNGYEFLKKVKAHNVYKKIPVMMVTTETEEGNIVRSIQAGAENYMIKPFTIEEMMKKILECLGNGC